MDALLVEISKNDITTAVARFCLTIIGYSDRATYLHSYNVLAIARRLIEELQISGEKKEAIEIGCLLHDIGKIIIPEALLRKIGTFSCDEYNEIKRHTLIGFTIMRQWGADVLPHEALEIILSHHEKNGGAGYPHRITTLPLHVEICAIADIAAAMQEHRHHRAGHSLERSIMEMKRFRWLPEIMSLLDSKPELFILHERNKDIVNKEEPHLILTDSEDH